MLLSVRDGSKTSLVLRVLKGIGWFLIAMAAISAFCSILALFDGDRGAVLGFLMFGAMFGFPGTILLWRGSRLEQEKKFRSELIGFIHTHDRFTVEEMARKIGRTEMETTQLIAQLVNEEKLDLLFHRPDHSYIHRNRIDQDAKVFDRCPSCAASLDQEVVLEGEAVACSYCGSRLG